MELVNYHLDLALSLASFSSLNFPFQVKMRFFVMFFQFVLLCIYFFSLISTIKKARPDLLQDVISTADPINLSLPDAEINKDNAGVYFS